MRCCFAWTQEVRGNLSKHPEITPTVVAVEAEAETANPTSDLEYIQALASAVVALLPASYESLSSLLSMSSPKAVYELHFSIFASLDRSAFNPLEQDGLQYLLSEYLHNVRSTEAYAAWKAGLVLGEGWLSARSEGLLQRLIATARYPAGRLGAVNGYRFIMQRRKTYTAKEFGVIRRAARTDTSLRVREAAAFWTKQLRQMQIEDEATSR